MAYANLRFLLLPSLRPGFSQYLLSCKELKKSSKLMREEVILGIANLSGDISSVLFHLSLLPSSLPFLCFIEAGRVIKGMT
jgi:hypothetical protein